MLEELSSIFLRGTISGGRVAPALATPTLPSAAAPSRAAPFLRAADLVLAAAAREIANAISTPTAPVTSTNLQINETTSTVAVSVTNVFPDPFADALPVTCATPDTPPTATADTATDSATSTTRVTTNYGVRAPSLLFLRMETVCCEIYYYSDRLGLIPHLYHEVGELAREFGWGYHSDMSPFEQQRCIMYREFISSMVRPVLKEGYLRPAANRRFDAATAASGATLRPIFFTGALGGHTEDLNLDLRVWPATTMRQIIKTICPHDMRTNESHVYVRGARVTLEATVKNAALDPSDVIMIADPRMLPPPLGNWDGVQFFALTPVLEDATHLQMRWLTKRALPTDSVAAWLRPIALAVGIPPSEMYVQINGKICTPEDTFKTAGLSLNMRIRIFIKTRGGGDTTPPAPRLSRRRLGSNSEFEDNATLPQTFDERRAEVEAEGPAAVAQHKSDLIRLDLRACNRALRKHGSSINPDHGAGTAKQILFVGYKYGLLPETSRTIESLRWYLQHRFNFTATSAMYPTRRDLTSKLDELTATALVDDPVICAWPGCPFPAIQDNTGTTAYCSGVHAAEAAEAAFATLEAPAPAPSLQQNPTRSRPTLRSSSAASPRRVHSASRNTLRPASAPRQRNRATPRQLPAAPPRQTLPSVLPCHPATGVPCSRTYCGHNS